MLTDIKTNIGMAGNKQDVYNSGYSNVSLIHQHYREGHLQKRKNKFVRKFTKLTLINDPGEREAQDHQSQINFHLQVSRSGKQTWK